MTVFDGYSPTKELEAAIFIGSRAPDNYYHWLINGVLKVFVANQGVKLSPEIPLLVPRAVEKWPQLGEALAFVAKGRRIVFFAEQDVIHVKELFVHDPPPASDTPLSRDVTRRVPLRVHREVLRAFRAEVLAKVITPVTTTGPRLRLFLLKPPDHPNAANQSELLEALSSFDFIAIEPEKMSFSQQVAIFSRAECVVGASGAGFTNILFAPAGCVSILWKAKSLIRENFFSNLAAIAEGHVYCLEFEQSDRGGSRDVGPKLLVETLLRAGVAGPVGS
ncbi:glycosyltransferase family 61 protein [Pontimonas sp.]|nr:glycosyltransferase family 61 protein [Pontimonas sp.]MDA8862982.1 glycosyltransferase family 61 protein [Pontimonas sp.]